MQNDKAFQPKVTVLMSTFNDEAYICEAIESILSQTYTDFEFIIINDGSRDATPDLIAKYKDPRIVLINQENAGLTVSLNRGLAAAKGEYIARQDADDISLPNRLEEQVKFLDSSRNVAVYGAAFNFIDEKGNFIRNYKASITQEEVENAFRLLNTPFPHSSVMYRKSIVLNEFGGYRLKAVKTEDYDLWLRVSEKYKITSSPNTLINLRYRPDSVSRIDKEPVQMQYGVIALLCSLYRKNGLKDPQETEQWDELVAQVKRWLQEHKYNNRTLAKKKFELVRMHIKNGDILKALKPLKDAIKYDPFFWKYRGINIDIEQLKNTFIKK